MCNNATVTILYEQAKYPRFSERPILRVTAYKFEPTEESRYYPKVAVIQSSETPNDHITFVNEADHIVIREAIALFDDQLAQLTEKENQ